MKERSGGGDHLSCLCVCPSLELEEERRRPGRRRVREDQEEEPRCLPSHPRWRRTPAGDILFPSFFDPFPAITTATGGRRRPRDIPDGSKRSRLQYCSPLPATFSRDRRLYWRQTLPCITGYSPDRSHVVTDPHRRRNL